MTKVALIQPLIMAGKSLGIQKSPESIQILAGQLKKAGFNVRMFHEIIDSKFIDAVKVFNPDIVGISTMTANFIEGKKVAFAIKKMNLRKKVYSKLDLVI